MARYFIEVAYKGTKYSGFQIQENANTIQSEIEIALHTLHRTPFQLTGSSRTDAGVHALQNFFHFDFDGDIHPQAVYKLNAILPKDIVVYNIYPMASDTHARFDALSRQYNYRIHCFKNPFLDGTSYYYPYKINMGLLNEAAAYIKEQQNFFAFSKTNTQVNNFNCMIYTSIWTEENGNLLFTIEGNRFLRGMVRLLTATLLKLGRGKMTFIQLSEFFKYERKVGLSVPSHGLYLSKVIYPENYFPATSLRFTSI